jgi:hypothetical protein
VETITARRYGQVVLLERTGRWSEIVEVGQPTLCPAGHRLGPRTVLVGFLPCFCRWPESGHRTFACRECGATLYQPEHDKAVLPPPR